MYVYCNTDLEHIVLTKNVACMHFCRHTVVAVGKKLFLYEWFPTASGSTRQCHCKRSCLYHANSKILVVEPGDAEVLICCEDGDCILIYVDELRRTHDADDNTHPYPPPGPIDDEETLQAPISVKIFVV